MKRMITFACCTLLGSALSQANTCPAPPLLVQNVHVWSPDAIARRQDVLVMDGHIRAVAATGELKPAAGTRILDGAGSVMLPGFIDAHVHFVLPGRVAAESQQHPWGVARFTGPQLVASGVTSARLHLDKITNARVLHEASRDPCAALPRLQVGGPAFIPGTPHDDQGVVWSPASPADATAKVRRLHELEFEWLAIHEAHRFGPAERDAILKSARELGLRILASGYSQEEVASALDLRPQTIDYLDVSPQPAYAEHLLERARQVPGLVWVARLGVHERYRNEQLNPAIVDDPFLYEFLTPEMAKQLRASVRQEVGDASTEHAKRMDAAYPTLRRKFAQLRATGIPLAAGTDAGSPGHFHRDAIWQELNAWIGYGASVTEALTAVTANGAKVLADDSIGHLRPGARADFILYRASLEEVPLQPRHVSAVAKGGVLFVADGRWQGGDPPR